MSVCLVAIAKNEGRFLTEWLAHYLTLGVDRIFLFDNESSDDTAGLVEAAAARYPVSRIPWPSPATRSPQVSAYNHAVQALAPGYEWVAFFDCDEFLVLRKDKTLGQFLGRFDAGVGAVGINWLSFGSSGWTASDYGLVTDAFTLGGRRAWRNNRHFKTIARTAAVTQVGVHHCELKAGLTVHPDGSPIVLDGKPGVADRVEHSLAQLNHYQIKSRADFDEKIRRGRAGKATNAATRFRPDPDAFFQALDRNERPYREIERTRPARLAIMAAIDAARSGNGPPPADDPTRPPPLPP